MDDREDGTAKKPGSGDSIDLSALGFRKVAYTVRETVELIGIGRTSIYAAIKRGDLGVGKAGRRTVLFAYDLAKYLNTLRVAPRSGLRISSGAEPPAQGPIISLLPRQQRAGRPATTWPIYLRGVHIGDLEDGGANGVTAYAVSGRERAKIGAFPNRRDAARAIRRGQS
ncbi:MAG: DNA-binding protein [Bradyrhizobium sp.]|nr:MAG: DNA-binding protein [Bradyrhizobium sp.]